MIRLCINCPVVKLIFQMIKLSFINTHLSAGGTAVVHSNSVTPSTAVILQEGVPTTGHLKLNIIYFKWQAFISHI